MIRIIRLCSLVLLVLSFTETTASGDAGFTEELSFFLSFEQELNNASELIANTAIVE